MTNVTWTQDKGLCFGCGACYVACPQEAIKIVNQGRNNSPVIDDNCTSCGICTKVCSGQHSESNESHSHFLKALRYGKDIYLAFSRKENIRRKGTSGGFVTQYLIDLLRKQVIDGAIVSTSDGTLESTKAIVARTEAEIVNSIGSKYYPVSNCAALKNIKPNEKYAFVGKGCDLSSLKLLQETMAEYHGAIYVKIGIFCHHTPHANASRQLLKSYGFGPRDIIVYRGRGWPGQTVLRGDNKETIIDYQESWGQCLGKVEHIPYRCAICTHSFAQCADIAVGDAWALNPDMDNKQEGFSLVLAYTEKGKNEIQRLKKSGTIDVKAADRDLLRSSQHNLIRKDEIANYRLFVLRLLNKTSPLNHIGYLSSLTSFCRFLITRGFSPSKLLSAVKFAIQNR